MVSFYPNQPALIKTNTGIFIAVTEDLFKGYYTYGLETNVPNCNRSAVLKNDKDLYFVNHKGDVVHYDLGTIILEHRTDQEKWGLNNVVKAWKVFNVNAKDINEGPGNTIYSLTATGVIRQLPEGPEFTVSNQFEGTKIFFTGIAATDDYVVASGYMPNNQHNIVHLVKGDLSAELDGPIMTKAASRFTFTV